MVEKEPTSITIAGNDIQIHKSPFRWLQLLLFSLLNASNSISWITFGAILNNTMDYFHISSLQANLLSMVFMATYFPFSVVSTIFLNSFGLRNCLLFGAILNCMGSWLRVISCGIEQEFNFYVLMGGQSLQAIAQCFILPIPALLAQNWFPSSERISAASIGAVFNQFGVALGFLIGPYLVLPSNFKQTLPIYLILQAVFASMIAILIALLFTEQPHTPPSVSAAYSRYEKEEKKKVDQLSKQSWIQNAVAPLKTELLYFWNGIRNVQFMLFVLLFGLNQGISYSLSGLLESIMVLQQFSQQDAGVIGFLFIVAGIVFSFIFAFIADKTKQNKWIVKLLYMASAICILLFFLVVVIGKQLLHLPYLFNLIGIYITFVSYGLFINALGSLSLDIVVELNYGKVSEFQSTAFLFSSSNFFGLISTPLIDYLIRLNDGNQLYICAIIICIIYILVGLAALLCFWPQQKRLELEKSRSSTSSLSDLTPLYPSEQQKEPSQHIQQVDSQEVEEEDGELVTQVEEA